MSVFGAASLPTAATQKQPVSEDGGGAGGGGSTEPTWSMCTTDVMRPQREQDPAIHNHADEPGGHDAERNGPDGSKTNTVGSHLRVES